MRRALVPLAVGDAELLGAKLRESLRDSSLPSHRAAPSDRSHLRVGRCGNAQPNGKTPVSSGFRNGSDGTRGRCAHRLKTAQQSRFAGFASRSTTKPEWAIGKVLGS
jgi:hypothetical protein